MRHLFFTEILTDDYLINTVFELRITPMLPEAMLDMTEGGVDGLTALSRAY